MTIDLNKVNQFYCARLRMIDPEDGEKVQTLEEVTAEAQRDTDRSNNPQGIFKLVAYTQPSPPLATVVTI